MRSSSSIVVQGGFLVHHIVIGLVGRSLRIVIASELEGSWLAGGQQEGLQYNGGSAWQEVIGIYIISADAKRKLKLALLKRS